MQNKEVLIKMYLEDLQVQIMYNKEKVVSSIPVSIDSMQGIFSFYFQYI
jgi:hypothetical protein